MKLVDSFIMAIRSLTANKMRSSLTILGIIIGVGAVITLMSVGRGAQASITSTYESLGTNVLSVIPRSPDVEGLAGLSPVFSTPTLTLDDARALERIPFIQAIAPTNENFIKVAVDGESKTSIIHGATPDYMVAYNHTLTAGQFLSTSNIGSRDMVAVLGSEVAQDLFPDSNPVGKVVKMKGHRFTVLGVLERKGGQLMGISIDNVVVVPITTFQTRLFTQRTPSGADAVASIAVRVESDERMEEVRDEIENILRKRHRVAAGEKDDFAVVSQEQVLGVMNQITGVFTIVLGAIAGISLIVGGIGIMNIMLVSVTERTREIGIRKAVGAKRRDILLQFLIESAMLSFSGGGIGIISGLVLSFIISQIDLGGTKIHSAVTPDIIILAVSVSIIIGLASGMYPATRASRLNPIEALRYE